MLLDVDEWCGLRYFSADVYFSETDFSLTDVCGEEEV